MNLIQEREVRHFHMCCGLGGGAKGFNEGQAQVGNMRAKMRCIGGVDVHPAAIRDFNRLSGVRGTVLDLFDREQYVAFHGKQPPPEWREATPDDIRRAANGERPHIMFTSSPCKGFSGLLSEKRSLEAAYQALNGLALRTIWLALEAWADDPPELILFENVPRILTRGRGLLDQIESLYAAYGYAVSQPPSIHDCGELGGLAQSRKRFLMVARHIAKVPPFLYEPPKRRLRAVGELLSRLPLPGDPACGPMHRIPNLQWKTWVRLAFVEAGSDWRSLNKLRVVDGKLADYLIVPEFWHQSVLGVVDWKGSTGTVIGNATPTAGAFSVGDPRAEEMRNKALGVGDWSKHSGTVTANGRPAAGSFSIADPRFDGQEYAQYGVRSWDQPAATIGGQQMPGQGKYAVADPRPGYPEITRQNIFRVVHFDQASHVITGASHVTGGAASVADPRFENVHHNNVFRIAKWNEPAGTVTAGHGPSSGGGAVADPRPPEGPQFRKYNTVGWNNPSSTVIGGDDCGAYAVADPRPGTTFAGKGKYIVSPYDKPANTVIGASTTGNGAFAVADPRSGLSREKGDDYLTAGHYGVIPWESPSGAVSGTAGHDNGKFNVADPRLGELPNGSDKMVCVIRALDGTWHRPFTTLELAVLQSLLDPDEAFGFDLDGKSDSDKRERIGNAVPPDAAAAIASVMAETLLLAWSGTTFHLSAQPIWVQPLAIALSVNPGMAMNSESPVED